MSREILFRGKSEEDGQWMHGYYCAEGYGGCDFPCILPSDGDGHISFAVDPDTVGQYTGRTAQCRDKIFEGDRCILTLFDHNGIDTQYEVIVKWMGGAFYFVNEGREVYVCVADVDDTDSDVEVISNIHDNPELLEATPCTE